MKNVIFLRIGHWYAMHSVKASLVGYRREFSIIMLLCVWYVYSSLIFKWCPHPAFELYLVHLMLSGRTKIQSWFLRYALALNSKFTHFIERMWLVNSASYIVWIGNDRLKWECKRQKNGKSLKVKISIWKDSCFESRMLPFARQLTTKVFVVGFVNMQ